MFWSGFSRVSSKIFFMTSKIGLILLFFLLHKIDNFVDRSIPGGPIVSRDPFRLELYDYAIVKHSLKIPGIVSRAEKSLHFSAICWIHDNVLMMILLVSFLKYISGHSLHLLFALKFLIIICFSGSVWLHQCCLHFSIKSKACFRRGTIRRTRLLSRKSIVSDCSNQNFYFIEISL